MLIQHIDKHGIYKKISILGIGLFMDVYVLSIHFVLNKKLSAQTLIGNINRGGIIVNV